MITPTESMLQVAATPSAIVSDEKLTYNRGKRDEDISSSIRTAATETSSSCFDFADESSSCLIEDDGSSGPLVTSKTRPILKHSDSNSSSSKSVGFDSVCIRSYQQTMGDNPAVSYGPPISLDWDYEEHEDVNIDEYEFQRGFARRNIQQMAISYYQRKAILTHDYGFTEEELKKAKKDANKIKLRRGVTNYFLPMMPVEDALASAGRKAKRMISKSKE